MEKEFTAIHTASSKMNVQGFAAFIAGITDAKTTGVFLEKQDGQLQYVVRDMRGTPVVIKETTGTNNTLRDCCGKCREKEHQTADPCNKDQKDNSSVPADATAIIKESRFSDLLILDAEMSFNNNQSGVLSDVTKQVLTKSECPVMIAPYAFEGIEEIIFAYDGSPSAVFAIRQFTWLFPGLTDKKLTVLQVNSQENGAVKDRENILGLLQMHYSSVGFRILNGVAGDELFNYLAGKKNAMVVMGAFGSPHLSMPYRESTAEPLVKTINLPLFIAHHL